MDDYYKAGHERLRELLSLHHYAITYILSLMRKQEENESGFWNSLKRNLEEEK